MKALMFNNKVSYKKYKTHLSTIKFTKLQFNKSRLNFVKYVGSNIVIKYIKNDLFLCGQYFIS